MDKKCLVILALIAALTFAGSLQAANVVGQWSMDENSGQVVGDSSSNGFDGQLGTTSGIDVKDPVWVTSYTDGWDVTRGAALELSGTYAGRTYVTLDPHVSSFTALTKGTISCFFKQDTLAESDPAPSSVTNRQTIFSVSDSTEGSVEYNLFCNFGVLKAISRGGTGNVSLASGPDMSGEDVGITDGKWHHAALTVDETGQAILYLDGVAVDSATGANFLNNVPTSNTMSLGVNKDNSSADQWGFDGLLDEVRIYDDALTAAEIKALIPQVGEFTETLDSTMVVENGATDTIDVVLNAAPLANVIVTLDPNSQLDLGLGAGVAKDLTFTSSNWATAQTVTITAVDDSDPEGEEIVSIKFSTSSTDSAFDGGWMNPRILMVTVVDNDGAGVLLIQSGNTTKVNEQGPTSDTYTMRLTTAPSSDVVITPANSVDPAQVSISPASVTFNSGNYNVAQTITVTAIDDTVLEMDGVTVVSNTITTTDAEYAVVTVNDVNVTVYDNECGAWGYNAVDFNDDCYVNLDDFALMAASWLNCSDPAGINCARYN